MNTIKLKVEGMSCNHCKVAVEKALKSLSGVESVQVDMGNHEVSVTGSTERERLVLVIEEAGYEVAG